jgi:hypothetical protein
MTCETPRLTSCIRTRQSAGRQLYIDICCQHVGSMATGWQDSLGIGVPVGAQRSPLSPNTTRFPVAGHTPKALARGLHLTLDDRERLRQGERFR